MPEENFRNISEQSIMGIIVIQDRNIVYVNETAANIIGYPVEQIIKWNIEGFNNLIPDEDFKINIDRLNVNKKYNESDFLENEYRIIHKSGKKIWVRSYSKNIIYYGKSATLNCFIDITKQKNTLEQVKVSEEKLRQIFEVFSDLFFLVTDDTTILDYKGRRENFFIPPEVFHLKKITDISPEIGQLFSQTIKKTLETKNP